MKKYNLSAIMKKAWQIFRNGCEDFAKALKLSWMAAKLNGDRIQQAKAAAGVTEETHTWAGWKALGYMVEHGSKALFQAVLDTPERGEGKTYRKSYFGRSQVQELAAE